MGTWRVKARGSTIHYPGDPQSGHHSSGPQKVGGLSGGSSTPWSCLLQAGLVMGSGQGSLCGFKAWCLNEQPARKYGCLAPTIMLPIFQLSERRKHIRKEKGMRGYKGMRGSTDTEPHLNTNCLSLKCLFHSSLCKGSGVSINLQVAFTPFHQPNHLCCILTGVTQPSATQAGLIFLLQHDENAE